MECLLSNQITWFELLLYKYIQHIFYCHILCNLPPLPATTVFGSVESHCIVTYYCVKCLYYNYSPIFRSMSISVFLHMGAGTPTRHCKVNLRGCMAVNWIKRHKKQVS